MQGCMAALHSQEAGNMATFSTVCREAGLVPDNIYPGLNYGEVKHNHNEMGCFPQRIYGRSN